ncbi:MAG: hypothetical protein HXY25_06645 [Alphaproteobacteria bacterium]|nr:hypothetical protein [Alphaproteobacteria bacterium]
MGINQLIAILWARRLIIVGCVIVLVAITGAITYSIPKQYEATTKVLIDSNEKNPVSDQVEQRLRLTEFLGRETALITSKRVSEQVVTDLKLQDRPDFQKAYLSATKGTQPIEDWIAGRLRQQISVWPAAKESAILITARATDPATAARYANAFAEAYITTSVELRQGAAERKSQILDEQQPELSAKLAEAQRRLRAFQEKHGIVGAGSLSEEQATLTRLTTDAADAAALAQNATLSAKLFHEALDGGREINSLPEVRANPIISQMRANLAMENANLADTRARFGTSHPNYTAGLARKRAMEDEIQSEFLKIGKGLDLAAENALRQVEDVNKNLEKQKQLVVALQEVQNEYDVLFREVQSRQAILSRVIQRGGEESLDSRLDNISAMIISKAEAPGAPSFPDVQLNIALATVMGGGLGVLVALLFEFLSRRILIDEDLVYATGAPVLLALPRRTNG